MRILSIDVSGSREWAAFCGAEDLLEDADLCVEDEDLVFIHLTDFLRVADAEDQCTGWLEPDKAKYHLIVERCRSDGLMGSGGSHLVFVSGYSPEVAREKMAPVFSMLENHRRDRLMLRGNIDRDASASELQLRLGDVVEKFLNRKAVLQPNDQAPSQDLCAVFQLVCQSYCLSLCSESRVPPRKKNAWTLARLMEFCQSVWAPFTEKGALKDDLRNAEYGDLAEVVNALASQCNWSCPALAEDIVNRYLSRWLSGVQER